MSGALVLFTRDLRVRDQPALAAAVREFDVVVPAFVFDRELLQGDAGSANRLAFLVDCLADLGSSLAERGGALVLRHGRPEQEAMQLVQQWGLSAICMGADVTPYAKRRHAALAAACEQARVELRTFPGVSAVSPGDVTPVGGDHYRVFTPYWRVWSQAHRKSAVAAPRHIDVPAGLKPSPLPTLAELTAASSSPDLPRGGERAARVQLDRWLRGGLAHYEELRDDLAGDATSKLSPHLHFGCLSVGTVLARIAGRGPGAEAFARQLCWRDFHQQVLAATPQMTTLDYRPLGDEWRVDALGYEAWQQGLTGYPIVDAGMRQLAREGFMHNRARMIVASFLTKTMYVDWRLGARHFARLLVDADVACNVGNWQWMAGTGNDTRPNRVLNPLRQAHRFDPQGEYVRRYVPELESLSGASVHEPWLLDKGAKSLGYPLPIVEHASAAAALRAARMTLF
jgi:deoxyribodipyrimidine photo-lyase